MYQIVLFAFTIVLEVSIDGTHGAEMDAEYVYGGKSPVGQISALDKATKWLLSKRQENWGWDSDTADAIVALQLANLSWASKDHLESQLSIKQLELDIALTLWSHHHDSPVRPGRVAKFINALVSVCRNPKSFYGHDLVAMLEHLDTSHPFEYSYVVLTLCTAGNAHIRKKQVRRLYSFVESQEVHNHDTLAMTVLALSCVVREHHNRNLAGYLRKPIKRLKKFQNEDGSFGNIHTSAIATQALLAVADDNHPDGNLTKAIDHIVQQQQPDGSFGNLLATMSVLPVLAGHYYAHLWNATCREEEQQSSDSFLSGDQVSLAPAKPTGEGPGLLTQTFPTMAISDSKLVTVKYSLWIGNNITENSTLSIVVPANTSFYEIMKIAAEENEKYEFSASLWPNGHYVHTLSGLKEDRAENHYWLLCLNHNGMENPVFVDTGVDDFYPQDGDNIVFWFKKI